MKKILYLHLFLLFLIGCQQKSSEQSSSEDENISIGNTVDSDEMSDMTSFEEFMAKVPDGGSGYDKKEHELGNYEETFTYQYSFRSMEEAISFLQQANMLEIDDYHPNKKPASSGRIIDFDLNLGSPLKIENVSINNKAVLVNPNDNPNPTKEIYLGHTSKMKRYEFEGESIEYSDYIAFALEFKEDELIGFEARSVLHGYLSDDELITNNPDNSLTLKELKASDEEVENTVGAACNGYKSIVKIAKANPELFNLSFAITTPGCAL